MQLVAVDVILNCLETAPDMLSSHTLLIGFQDISETNKGDFGHAGRSPLLTKV